MAGDYFEMAFRMAAALVAGGLIGLERSHRGRPAGFRTHALVCLASSSADAGDRVRRPLVSADAAARVVLDPTRMAQGIMTGIGFLGAGAIIKEGFSVRGLTTAASIWITAAIGILTGVGFYFAALVGTVLDPRHAVDLPLDRGAPADRDLRHLHGALRARGCHGRAGAAQPGRRRTASRSTTSATACTATPASSNTAWCCARWTPATRARSPRS